MEAALTVESEEEVETRVSSDRRIVLLIMES